MEFRVLGPLEVVGSDGPITLTRPKQRAIVALLLLHANEVVSSDRIVDLVWGEAPPETAATALRVQISRLRKLLGRELIETRAPGYALRIAPEQLDLARFERLVAEARHLSPPDRAERLREALALWRGEPLADLTYEPFLQAEIARLAELRLAAREDEIDSELEFGRAAELVGELERLVAAHPFRERLRAQLMLALYLAGRQAEALEVYRQARLLLSEELGLEPSPVLKRLERQILSQDAALELAPPEEAPVGLREEHKLVSALVIQLAGADAAVRSEVERFGGTVERQIGDSLMCFFGAPRAHEDDAERAVRAALTARNAAATLRAAVTTGEALVTLRERGEEEPIASGEPVSLAVRLHRVAAAGQILVDAATYRATDRVFCYSTVDPLVIAGSKPRPVWQATALRPLRRRGPSKTLLVGREHELALLGQTYRRTVREREVQLVTITGEPGIGKTRLVTELRKLLQEREAGFLWHEGHCLPYGEETGFWALGEIVKAQAGIDASDAAEAAAAKLQRAVRSAIAEANEAQWIELHLRPFVGARAGQEQSPERTEVFTAWRRYLEALAEERPLILALDDLHWADDSLLAFLEHLIERAAGVPILLCCTARPEFFDRSPGWGGGKRNVTTLALTPLSRDETAELLAELLKRPVLPAETQGAILDRCGGNPLYAGEFARMISQRRSRTWTEIPVPETIQALIAARLDTLPPEQKAMLQDAAVVGEAFWPGALAAIGARDQAAVEDQLHELVRREFIRPVRPSSVEGQPEYAFLHVLIRDVAHGQIPRAARAEKHQAIARWVEAVAAERLDDYAELLAYHYGEALAAAQEAAKSVPELEEKVFNLLVLAGDRAFQLDVDAARDYYGRALELLPSFRPERGRLLLKAGRATMYAGAEDAALQKFEEAAAVSRSRDDRRGAAAALTELSRMGWKHRLLPKLPGEYLAEALELLHDDPLAPERATIYVLRGANSLEAGRFEEARADSERAIALGKRHGLHGEELDGHLILGLARCARGDARGIQELRSGLSEALELGLSLPTCHLYGNLAVVVWRAEGSAAALEVARSGIEFSERRGNTVWVLDQQGTAAQVLYELGRWEELCPLADEMIERDRRGGWSVPEARAAACKARVLACEGKTAEAASLIAEVLPLSREIGRPEAAGPVFTAAAMVQYACGNVASALALIEEFDEATAESGYALWVRTPFLPDAVRICGAAGATELGAGLLARTPAPLAGDRYPALTCRAILSEAEGDVAGALDLYTQAVEGWTEFGNVVEQALALFGAGRCLRGLGRHGQGAENLANAREIFATVGATRLVEEVESELEKQVPLSA